MIAESSFLVLVPCKVLDTGSLCVLGLKWQVVYSFDLHALLLKNLFYLFIYFWLCWVSVAAHRLSLVVASGGYHALLFIASFLRVNGEY